jgi:hypothetical protein
MQSNGLLRDNNNVQYSPWSRATLMSPFVDGKLNALDFSTQTQAIQRKWIRSFVNPKKETWKTMPLEVLSTTFLQNHIFISHPTTAKLILNSRWNTYLKGWFHNITITPPPLDYTYL